MRVRLGYYNHGPYIADTGEVLVVNWYAGWKQEDGPVRTAHPSRTTAVLTRFALPLGCCSLWGCTSARPFLVTSTWSNDDAMLTIPTRVGAPAGRGSA